MSSPDSLELLARYGRVEPADESVIAAAAVAVLDAPDLQRVSGRRSGPGRRTLVGAASVAAAVALAVAGISLATSATKAPGRAAHAESPAAKDQQKKNPEAILVRLASAVLASPPPAGDATLVIRSAVGDSGGTTVLGADLYTDSGKYYFAPTESGLPAQVAAGNDEGDGIFAREIAAASFAATGNLTSAAEQMEMAPDPSGTVPPSGGLLADNWLWENSLDALVAGSGNPTVRAGVMRLISLIPEVAVSDTTANGKPAIQLTGTFPGTSKCPTAQSDGSACGIVGGGIQEELTIDAATGIPLSFWGGAIGQKPSDQITYQVSRVTLSQVAQGHFVAEVPTSPTGA